MAQGDGEEIAWLELLVAELRRQHDRILDSSGGMFGEHTSRLYAVAARPFQSAFGEDVYQTPFERAAALMHGIICDHVFADGNKRTGSLAAIWMLTAFGVLTEERPPSNLQVRMVGEVALEAASAGLTVEQVTHWLHRIFD
jgi:death-on-curing family protein